MAQIVAFYMNSGATAPSSHVQNQEELIQTSNFREFSSSSSSSGLAHTLPSESMSHYDKTWSNYILTEVLQSNPNNWGKTPTDEIFNLNFAQNNTSPMATVMKHRKIPGVIGAGAKKCGTIAFSTFMSLNPEVLISI